MAYQSRPANETVSERFLTIITTQRALSQIFQRRACTFRLFQNSIDAVNKFKMRILCRLILHEKGEAFEHTKNIQSAAINLLNCPNPRQSR